MRLEALEIRTLPGIDPGFLLEDIASGCNLVTGPNAVGKSSLIRALGYLVGAARGDDPPALALMAVFTCDDHRFTVRRTGREILWEADGRAADRPALPDRDQLDCYWLCMEDLLRADQRDARLITELKRALGGGYDLEALRQGAPFLLGARHGHNEARTLRNAERDLRTVEAEYASLRGEEDQVPALERDIRLARDAAARATRLEQALALVAARRQRREIETGLSSFPGNLERLRGDEVTRLDDIDRKRASLREALGVGAAALEEAERRLQESGLAEGRPQVADLRVQSHHLAEARRKADQREGQQQRLAEAGAARARALIQLGADRALPHLDPGSVSRAEGLARALQSAEQGRDGLARALEQTDAPAGPGRLDDHLQALEALRAWLAHDGATTTRIRLAMLLAVAGALVAVVLAGLARAWPALLGGCIAVAGAAWALFASRHDARAAARTRFEGSGLEGPMAWQREAVRARLRVIEDEWQVMQQQALRARQAADTRDRLEVAERHLADLQRQKADLALELGFDPALTAAALDRFVRLVQEYERAAHEHEIARAGIDRLHDGIEDLAGRIQTFLERWRPLPVADEGLDAMDAALEDLRLRREQGADAERMARDAEGACARARRELVALDEDEAALFRDAGLEPGQRAELTRCCEQVDAWREHQGQLRDARVREAERREALVDERELLDRVEADERAGLEEDLERARARAEALDRLQEERTTLRTRLREAGHDRLLEQAMAEVDKARSALADRYDASLFAEAAGVLLDDVQQSYRSEHEPAVLRDARERFRRFTHHAFELELDEVEGFTAVDVQQQARRGLSELSSGTRMQLLLATRLAWMRHQERGRAALPLFLDEALTTTDEDRFNQVARSLEQLARDEGRQVFYLSARRQELALWERATGTRPHHIDLAAVRFGRTDTSPDDFVLPPMASVPAPADHSPQSYAVALGVPPVDPRQAAGAIHLFHLLRDDLSLLHQLMASWRITTLGQLEVLLGDGAAPRAVPDAAIRRCLAGRSAAARAWIAAWRHGRGKPVDRIALERAEAVSAVFIDRVAELAHACGGDGSALVAALRRGEIPRFRQSSAEELSEWLTAEGHIESETPLSRAERERRTLLTVAHLAGPDDVRRVVAWLEAGRGAGD